jgi:hypothetical protein
MFLMMGLLSTSFGEEALKTKDEPRPLREFIGEAGEGVEKGPVHDVIQDQASYERIWRNLGLGKNPGEIDFSKEFGVISTTRGSRVSFRLRDEGDGKLNVMSISTRDIRPGLRYAIGVLSRSEWKQVNDTRL